MADDLVTSLSNAIEQFEGKKPGSRSQRNNNPGNLRSGPGQTGTDDAGFAIFPDAQTGRRALEDQVKSNIGKGLTLQEFFGGKPGVYPGYAPEADVNDPKGYAQFVAGQLGINPADVLGKGSMADQTIEKKLPDGRTLRFPAGTTPQEIDQYVQQYYPPPKGPGPVRETQLSPLEKWSRTEGPSDVGLLGAINPITGAKKMTRAFYEPDFLKGASDFMEGAGTEVGDIATLLSLGTGVPEVLGGAGLLEAYGPRLMGLGKALAWGAGGSALGAGGGQVMTGLTGNPEWQRFGEDVGGWVGAGLGPKYGPRAAKFAVTNPYARTALGAALGHVGFGGPWGEILGGAAGASPEILGKFGFRRGGGGERTPEVRPPNIPQAHINRMNESLANGTLSPQDYINELMQYRVSQPMAQAMLRTAMLRAGQETTLQPSGAADVPMQGQTPGGPPSGTPVTLPPTVRVNDPRQMMLNLQNNPILQQPQTQPAGPQDPRQLRLPFDGGPPQQPPEQMQLPGTNIPQPPRPGTPAFALPPQPSPQQMNLFPTVRPPGAEQLQLPLGRPDTMQQELPFTPEEDIGNTARMLADEVIRKNPKRTGSPYIRSAAKRLGIEPTPELMSETTRVIAARKRTGQPTPAYPEAFPPRTIPPKGEAPETRTPGATPIVEGLVPSPKAERDAWNKKLDDMRRESGGRITPEIREHLNSQSPADWLENHMDEQGITDEEGKKSIRFSHARWRRAQKLWNEFLDAHPDTTRWTERDRLSYNNLNQAVSQFRDQYNSEWNKWAPPSAQARGERPGNLRPVEPPAGAITPEEGAALERIFDDHNVPEEGRAVLRQRFWALRRERIAAEDFIREYGEDPFQWPQHARDLAENLTSRLDRAREEFERGMEIYTGRGRTSGEVQPPREGQQGYEPSLEEIEDTARQILERESIQEAERIYGLSSDEPDITSRRIFEHMARVERKNLMSEGIRRKVTSLQYREGLKEKLRLEKVPTVEEVIEILDRLMGGNPPPR